MSEQNPPAGWYPQGAVERYWDGAAWTEQSRPLPAAQPIQTMPAGHYQQPKKSHAVRNVLLVLVVLAVLFVGGCLAVLGLAANEVDKDQHKAGGSHNPMTITEGKAFEVDGFNYLDGWTVGNDALGDLDVKGLKVTNNRSDKDSAIVELKFWKGTEVLALADCSTDPIDVGTTVKVSCISTDALPKSYEKITINDTF